VAPRDPADLDSADNWTGGFYELAIELGPRHDGRLDQAVRALWEAADVDGCFAPSDGPTNLFSHAPAELSGASLEQHGHLRGTVQPPGFARLVAGSVVVRFDGAEDWLTLYVPIGALSIADPRVDSFPFGPAGENVSLQWRRGLDDWLAEAGRAVYARVPFRRAAIGYETLDSEQFDQWLEAPADDRMCAFLIPSDAGVAYLPATGSPTSNFG
jgi:hypothetical protein